MTHPTTPSTPAGTLSRRQRQSFVAANTLSYFGLLGFWSLGNRLESLPFYSLAAACPLLFGYSFYRVFL